MPGKPLNPVGETSTLVEGRDFALISAFVDGLCDTVLVQAFRNDICPPTLYVVYREGGMTFDAIVALAPADSRARLDEVVREFVSGNLFYPTIVEPMKAAIERHFHRHIVR
jgi:hypothetical protein